MRPRDFLGIAKSFTASDDDIVEIPAPQNWYDSLLNGINRTGRPILLVASVAFFMWGIVDPAGFVISMHAFKETPEFVASAILLVISIFGTGRVINDVRKRHVFKQQVKAITPTPEPEPNERRFNNLKENNLEHMESDDVITSLPPENSSISSWQSKNHAFSGS